MENTGNSFSVWNLLCCNSETWSKAQVIDHNEKNALMKIIDKSQSTCQRRETLKRNGRLLKVKAQCGVIPTICVQAGAVLRLSYTLSSLKIIDKGKKAYPTGSPNVVSFIENEKAPLYKLKMTLNFPSPWPTHVHNWFQSCSGTGNENNWATNKM